MKISARNIIRGTVKKIIIGAVNCEVILTLPDGTELVSVITNGSAQALDLQEGMSAYAVIKASNVMIAVD